LKTHSLKALKIICLLWISASAFAAPLSSVISQTYELAEPDGLQEIYDRVKAADWEKAFTQNPVRDMSAFQPFHLPLTTETRTRYHIPWYTLDIDLADHHGKVVYPKGFRFNPLDYITMPTRLVVFPENQIDSLREHFKPHDMLILSQGDVFEAMKKLRKPVFILDKRLAERFGLQVSPSIIRQSGTTLQIDEIEAVL